jgi:cytochrome c biogenesis protein CcmG/thiol:disulfide interchange protein DsbE
VSGRPTEPFVFRPVGKKVRPALAWLLGLTIVGIVVVVVLAIVLSPQTPLRTATLPVADRTASAALRNAAEAVHFHPTPGAGTIEGKPASAAAPPSGGLLPVGSRAPAFALRTPTGGQVRLRDLRGRPVLIEFFATWCPHCAAEAPHLRRLYTRLAKSRVAFLAVNADSEDAPSVFAFHVYFGLPFPALVDAGGRSVSWPAKGPVGPVSSSYRVASFPTVYVLDSRGRIAWRSAGEQPDALLRQELLRAASM